MKLKAVIHRSSGLPCFIVGGYPVIADFDDFTMFVNEDEILPYGIPSDYRVWKVPQAFFLDRFS